jgi:transposase-like protein
MRESDQREEAIRLYLEEHLSYRDVAVRMQLPRDTVKSWVRRYRRANGLISESPSAKKIMKNAQRGCIASKDYEKRIEQLEMEVELLRDFLCEEERRSIKR